MKIQNLFKVSCKACAAVVFCLMQAPSALAAYPEQPVDLVVAFAPGGGTDIMGRLLAVRLSESLGQSFHVENRPGAGAMIGADYVAKAAPDGYTLLLGTSAEMTISPPLYGHSSYDPSKDFVPIALLGVSPAILLANPKFEGKTMQDIIAIAKQHPGTLSIGSGGAGTAPHLAGELLKSTAGIDFMLIPYKGAGPEQIDLMGGQIPLAFSTIASSMQDIKAGRIRPVAVVSSKRTAVLPDVPTVAEQGVKDYQVVTWFGLFAPAGTPPEVIERLRGAVAKALAEKDLQARLEGLGIDAAPATQSGTALQTRVKDELASWTRIIKDGNIKPE